MYLNDHVMQLNGGLMPIVPRSDADRIGWAQTVEDERAQGNQSHQMATPATQWAWAADRIPVVSGDHRRYMYMYSLGDLLMNLSILLFILLAILLFMSANILCLYFYLTAKADYTSLGPPHREQPI